MRPCDRSDFIAALDRNAPEVRNELWALVRAEGYNVDLRPWLARWRLDVHGLEWFAEDARTRARFMAVRGDRPWRGPAAATRTAEFQYLENEIAIGPQPPRWEPAITKESREAARARFEAYLDAVEKAEAEAGRELTAERSTKIPPPVRWDLLVRRLVRAESYESLADWLATKICTDDPPGARGVENAVLSLAKRIGVAL